MIVSEQLTESSRLSARPLPRETSDAVTGEVGVQRRSGSPAVTNVSALGSLHVRIRCAHIYIQISGKQTHLFAYGYEAGGHFTKGRTVLRRTRRQIGRIQFYTKIFLSASLSPCAPSAHRDVSGARLHRLEASVGGDH